jgi:hypothetical protein
VIELGLGVIAFLFALMGVAAIAAPQRIYATWGVRDFGADARNEVRAVYGGFGVALAAILVVAIAADAELREGIMLAIGVAVGGMAAGRAISALIEWPKRIYPVWFYGALETVIATVLIAGA